MKLLVETEPKTQLAELLVAKMEEQGKTAKELAEKFDVTYEHIRRIVRGEGIPSRFILKMFADELGLPYKELEKVATGDKIRKKYGALPEELTGKNPALEPMERIWSKLTGEQHTTLIDMATNFVKRNRAMKASL